MARNREFDETKVIQTATALFWEKGYNAVSTQDLIDAFGISRSSMYGAYKDKRSLFILALQNYRQTASQSIITALNRNGSFIEIITTILNQVVKENQGGGQNNGCFIVNTAIELAQHDKEILHIIRQNREMVTTAIAAAVRKAVANKELSKKNDPKALGNYFYNLINGLRVDGKVTNNSDDYKATVQLALKVIERV
jgi:TetR/AcrR family transcriptional regulator, transcriptional repressor for nem operon